MKRKPRQLDPEKKATGPYFVTYLPIFLDYLTVEKGLAKSRQLCRRSAIGGCGCHGKLFRRGPRNARAGDDDTEHGCPEGSGDSFLRYHVPGSAVELVETRASKAQGKTLEVASVSAFDLEGLEEENEGMG